MGVPKFKTDREALVYGIHELRNTLVPLLLYGDLPEKAKDDIRRALSVAMAHEYHLTRLGAIPGE